MPTPVPALHTSRRRLSTAVPRWARWTLAALPYLAARVLLTQQHPALGLLADAAAGALLAAWSAPYRRRNRANAALWNAYQAEIDAAGGLHQLDAQRHAHWVKRLHHNAGAPALRPPVLP